MTLAELVRDLERRRTDAERVHATAPVAEVYAAVLADLGRLNGGQPAPDPEPVSGPTLLTPQQAAAELGVTPRWLYRHAPRLPFTRRLSRRALRFDRAGLQRWAASRPARG